MTPSVTVNKRSQCNATPILSSECLQLSRQHLNTRGGLGEGWGDTVALLTSPPRPCTSPSSVNSPPPLDHGLDTCCFLAASLLSSFTRDSNLESEPALADTILVVLDADIFKSSLAVSPHHRFWSPAARSAALPPTHATCSGQAPVPGPSCLLPSSRLNSKFECVPGREN